MKRFVVLIAAFHVFGCANGSKKGPVVVDETKVRPHLVSAGDDAKAKKSDWKYSNDCKTWMTADQYHVQSQELTTKPRYSYEQLTTSDPGMNLEPRLIQWDSKEKVIVGDNMTFLTQYTPAPAVKDRSHNPNKDIPKEFVERSFNHGPNAFALTSSRLRAQELNSDMGWLRDARTQGWKLAKSEPGNALTITYAFSGRAEDVADEKNLAHRYLLLVCKTTGCRLLKKAPVNPADPYNREAVELSKNSLELAELRDLSGFNSKFVSEIDQMCTPATRTQFVKQLHAQREEYANSCKVILSDDSVVRKWTETCNAYRSQLRPVVSALF